MNCFNHSDTVAIGICKVCNKGLCSDCLTDLDYGVACKNKHENDVNDYKLITDKSAEIYKKAPKNTLIAPVFYLFMGLVFSGFGYLKGGGVTNLAFILGMGFIAFGIAIFIANKSIYKKHNSR